MAARKNWNNGTEGLPGPSRSRYQGEPGKTIQPSINRINEGRRHEATAQVVQELPLLDQWQRVGSKTVRSWYSPEKPRQELPIAADPTMLAAGKCVIPGGKVVEELRVAEQTATSVVALDQVVAKNMVLRKRVARGRIERIDIIDSLTCEAADAEQVHIGVGSSRRVRIDSAGNRQELQRIANASPP